MMADAQGGQDSAWRTPGFRQKVVAQIEEAMRQSGNPIIKSSLEMESHVFQKARSREEYLGMVARLIIHVRDSIAKNKQQQSQQQGGSAAAAGQLGVAGSQDPINALQNLTRLPGPNPAMMPQPPQTQGMVGIPGQGGMPPAQMPPQQQTMQQRAPFQTYQGSAASMPGQQPNINPHSTAGWPGSNMMQSGAPASQQQQQPPQQQQMPGQQQNTHLTGSIAMPQAPSQPPQSLMHGMNQQYGGTPQVSLGKPVTGVASAPRATMLSGGTQGGFASPSPGAPSLGGSVPPYTPPASLGLGQPLPVSGASPMTSTSGSMGNLMPSPSPQPGVAPSPATRPLSGIPSPSVPLNTPVNPSSVNNTAASPAVGSAEEQAYLEKWKQLQKYKEPLKRMIHRIDKDEDRKIDLKKMTNLLNILSDSCRRLPMATLLKCEQALERLDLQSKSGSVPSVPTPTTAPGSTTVVGKPTEQHLCQPLLDAVAQHIHNPTVNHTLQRTFGPAIKTLHGTDICSFSRPAKRQKTEESEDKVSLLTDVLQGEVARLDRRFHAKYDPLHKKGSNCIGIICTMNDKNLPSVPPLHVEVPEDYPVSSPVCKTADTAYEATEFLQKVKSVLDSQVEHMPNTYSLTALLDVWEMSVRKACEPVDTD